MRIEVLADVKPLLGEEAPAARQHLHQVADQVLGSLLADGGVDPVLFAWMQTRWTAGLRDRRPAGLLAVWLDLEITGLPLVPRAVEHRPVAHEPCVVLLFEPAEVQTAGDSDDPRGLGREGIRPLR